MDPCKMEVESDNKSLSENFFMHGIPDKWQLPNAIQLIESELPIIEAENNSALEGLFLFRQVCSPYDQKLQCLLCHDKQYLTDLSDLEKHYIRVHDLKVHTVKAYFSENTVFMCVSSCVNGFTIVNFPCRFCDTSLKNLAEARDHFSAIHKKRVRQLRESDVMEASSYFYCCLCEEASFDFQSHSRHTIMEHKMKNCLCKHCKFCTSIPPQSSVNETDERAFDVHQCPVCPEYFHNKDKMTKHIMLLHAILTGPKTWFCSRCFHECGVSPDLIAHVTSCSKTSTHSKTKSESSVAALNVFYRCYICPVTLLPREENKEDQEDETFLLSPLLEMREAVLHGQGDALERDSINALHSQQKQPDLKPATVVEESKDRTENKEQTTLFCREGSAELVSMDEVTGRNHPGQTSDSPVREELERIVERSPQEIIDFFAGRSNTAETTKTLYIEDEETNLLSEELESRTLNELVGIYDEEPGDEGCEIELIEKFEHFSIREDELPSTNAVPDDDDLCEPSVPDDDLCEPSVPDDDDDLCEPSVPDDDDLCEPSDSLFFPYEISSSVHSVPPPELDAEIALKDIFEDNHEGTL